MAKHQNTHICNISANTCARSTKVVSLKMWKCMRSFQGTTPIIMLYYQNAPLSLFPYPLQPLANNTCTLCSKTGPLVMVRFTLPFAMGSICVLFTGRNT